jgi:hypothetical protein
MCGIVGVSPNIVPGKPLFGPAPLDKNLVLVNPLAQAYKEILPMIISGFPPAHTGDHL